MDVRGLGDRGQRERRDRAADRDRGLPDAERQPALAAREPAHHGPAAARVDRSPGRSGQREEYEERRPARDGRRRRQRERSTEQAGRDDDPLAHPIRGEPPRQQRQDEPDARRRQDGADLVEREPELRAERGRERREPDQQRGEGRLGRRPGRKHRPAVRLRRYSPNGLIGREPVETSTLFVSR